MSIKIKAFITCDYCGVWEFIVAPRRDAKKIVFKGWERRKEGKKSVDLCPTCKRLREIHEWEKAAKDRPGRVIKDGEG